MRNKKPLQFMKELPSHAELWKIIDNTIIYPGEGLSVEEIKHYMYVYLCTTPDFSSSKNMLQTDMKPEDLQTVNGTLSRLRYLLYPELLPVIEGLPSSLLEFIYCYYISVMTLPEDYAEYFKNIEYITNDKFDLSLLPHSNEVVEIYEKRQVELVVYRALLEKMPIPTFRLVAEPTGEAL